MLTDSDIEKQTEIAKLQKEIRRGQIKLLSMAVLVIVPLITVLAGVVTPESHASDSSNESSWFPGGLSTVSLLLMAVIWFVPLAFIIQSIWHELGTERDMLSELQQSDTEQLSQG